MTHWSPLPVECETLHIPPSRFSQGVNASSFNMQVRSSDINNMLLVFISHTSDGNTAKARARPHEPPCERMKALDVDDPITCRVFPVCYVDPNGLEALEFR